MQVIRKNCYVQIIPFGIPQRQHKHWSGAAGPITKGKRKIYLQKKDKTNHLLGVKHQTLGNDRNRVKKERKGKHSGYLSLCLFIILMTITPVF